MAQRKRRTLSAHPEAPTSKQGRLDYIVSLMAQNLWVTGVTGVELAEAWGLSAETLAKDAAEASRTFTANPLDRAFLQARWHAKIEGAQAQAARMGRLEALASLLKLEGDHLGTFEEAKPAEGSRRIEVVFSEAPGLEEP
jgi:hypothetical protein